MWLRWVNFSPRLVKKPGYPRHQAAWYQQQMHDRVVKLPEDTPVSLTIAYVDYQEASTAAFVEAFKPFVLARPIRPITAEFDAVPSPAEIRTYQDYLAAEAKELRNRSSRIGEFTPHPEPVAVPPARSQFQF